MDNDTIEAIRLIDVLKSDDWDSGMFPYMTNEQIIKCHHSIYRRILRAVIELRGETNIFDVAANDIVALLLKETEKRVKQFPDIIEEDMIIIPNEDE